MTSEGQSVCVYVRDSRKHTSRAASKHYANESDMNMNSDLSMSFVIIIGCIKLILLSFSGRSVGRGK